MCSFVKKVLRDQTKNSALLKLLLIDNVEMNSEKKPFGGYGNSCFTGVVCKDSEFCCYGLFFMSNNHVINLL